LIELSFRHELYDAHAIDEAVKIYAAYGAVDAERGDEAWRVRVSAGESGIDERTLAAELSNYALGITIERARQIAGEEAEK
jgi:hypothetical protein